MFEVGDTIVCGNNGICRVNEISTIKDISGIDPNRLYYILEPVMTKASSVVIPVDSDKVVMRKVLTKKEVNRLIEHIPEIEAIREKNDKVREEKFKECMRCHDCEEWIKVIKTLYIRRQERFAKGQKVTATDARYLKAAEDNLYAEFALALEIDKEEVEQFIDERIKKKHLDKTIKITSKAMKEEEAAAKKTVKKTATAKSTTTKKDTKQTGKTAPQVTARKAVAK